jgi:hypothetical protein
MPALASIDAESVFHKSKRQVVEAICPCYFDDEESCNVGGRLEQLCSGDRISKDGECEAWETYMDSVMKEYAQRPEASESARRVAGREFHHLPFRGFQNQNASQIVVP